MAYKHPVDTSPIKGKNWTLEFGLRESTGGVNEGGMPSPYNLKGIPEAINFTCASACMWNVNFKKNDGSLSAYGHMGPSPVPVEERHGLYSELVKRYADNTYMVQMVGVVNGGTDARLKHYLQSENKHGYHTYDFANYLITQKIGVVVESPVFINTYHKWEGPSICQAWLWFSPSIIAQRALVEHTGGIHGLDKVARYLQDSELNKKNVGNFDGLLAKPLVSEPRFAKAAEVWNKAMHDQGISPTITDDTVTGVTRNGKWKKVGNF